MRSKLRRSWDLFLTHCTRFDRRSRTLCRNIEQNICTSDQGYRFVAKMLTPPSLITTLGIAIIKPTAPTARVKSGFSTEKQRGCKPRKLPSPRLLNWAQPPDLLQIDAPASLASEPHLHEHFHHNGTEQAALPIGPHDLPAWFCVSGILEPLIPPYSHVALTARRTEQGDSSLHQAGCPATESCRRWALS